MSNINKLESVHECLLRFLSYDNWIMMQMNEEMKEESDFYYGIEKCVLRTFASINELFSNEDVLNNVKEYKVMYMFKALNKAKAHALEYLEIFENYRLDTYSLIDVVQGIVSRLLETLEDMLFEGKTKRGRLTKVLAEPPEYINNPYDDYITYENYRGGW